MSSVDGSRGGEMESGNDGGKVLVFLREKGLQDESIEYMLRKCVRLGVANVTEKVRENWNFLEKEVAIPARKLPTVVHRCPQLLVMGVNERLFPMLSCLRALGLNDKELSGVVSRFPHLLTHSVEEKLCPVLAFLQGIGVTKTNIPKVLLRCPRLLSYSIERKLAPTVEFLSSLGLGKVELGRTLTLTPNILGYGVETRLRPTVQYLQRIGLSAEQLRNVAMFFPHILCREAEKALSPAEVFLRNFGFSAQEVSILVSGFPPILTKSVKNSLEPKLQFLVNVMGRSKEEVVSFPNYFGYSLRRTIEIRFRKTREGGFWISLSDMLACSKRNFDIRIGSRQQVDKVKLENPDHRLLQLTT